MRTFTVGYGGISGEITKQTAESVLKCLEEIYTGENIDLVKIENINIESEIYKALCVKETIANSTIILPITRQWAINVTGSYDAYWASLSKNVKKNVKNYANRLTKKYGASIEIKKYQSIEEVDQLLEDTEKIAQNTYHRGLGVGFILNDETSNYYHKMLERNALRSYILYIDKKPVAFWSATKYQNIFYMITTGYLPEYRDDHVGTYLLIKTIEDAMHDSSINKIDFGLGDAEYKKIYCDECNELTTVHKYSNTGRGKLLYLSNNMIQKAEEKARMILLKYNLEGKIKQRWRKQYEKRK